MSVPAPMKLRADFDLVRSSGRTVSGELMNLRGTTKSSKDIVPTRIGLAVSKRSRNAVQRNRVVRRLRRAVVDVERVKEWPSGRYVIIAKDCIDDVPYTELIDEIIKLVSALEHKLHSVEAKG